MIIIMVKTVFFFLIITLDYYYYFRPNLWFDEEKEKIIAKLLGTFEI